MLALPMVLLFLTMLIIPAIAYEPPWPREPETEIAVKIEDDWHHTMHEWNLSVCEFDYNLTDDTMWWHPFFLTSPATGTTISVEVWLLEAFELYSYAFILVWNHAWLELTDFTVVDLPGEPGLTAAAEVRYFDDPDNEEPYYYQVWSFLGNVTGFSGDAVVTELTFTVLQDPVYPDSFYSLFYIYWADAATDCGERIPLSKQPAMVKLHSTPTIVTKELSKNITWTIDDEIVMDINIYNATKLKSFEFVLNMPPWLYVDLQEDPIVIGDFLPPPYMELVIVKGTGEGNFPWVCEDQIWIKVIRDCEKDPVSGDGTLVTITFKVDNPFIYMDEGYPDTPGAWQVGPEYTYNETLHLWVPEKIDDPICFKEVVWEEEVLFEEDTFYLDGIRGFQEVIDNPQNWCYDHNQTQKAVLLGPPFGSPMEHEPYFMEVEVEKVDVIFAPIPGDGNLDGHVGLLDLLIGVPFFGVTKVGANYYDFYGVLIDQEAAAEELGMPSDVFWRKTFKAADINGDNTVDLLDLVQMAKNWCRNEPLLATILDP